MAAVAKKPDPYFVPYNKKMEYKFSEDEIVMYKKDNSIYKIVEIVQINNVITGISMESYTISNDHKKVSLVPAKDLELL